MKGGKSNSKNLTKNTACVSFRRKIFREIVTTDTNVVLEVVVASYGLGVAYMRLGRLVTDETRALSQFYARYSTIAHWLKNSKHNLTLLNPFTVDAVLQGTNMLCNSI